MYVCVSVGVSVLVSCNGGPTLWEQLVSGVSVQYPHPNFVQMPNSGATFSPKFKVNITKTDLYAWGEDCHFPRYSEYQHFFRFTSDYLFYSIYFYSMTALVIQAV